MIKELDFEEIDQIVEDMGNTEVITDAIAADVAKVSSAAKKPVAKKPKKPAAKKAAPVKATPKVPISKKTAAPKKSDKGQLVNVKILTKPQPEEEPEIVPNPKTGKFMDVISPLSDMSIRGQRPTKPKSAQPTPEIEVVTSSTTTIIATDLPEAAELDEAYQPEAELPDIPEPEAEPDAASLEEAEPAVTIGDLELDPNATIEELEQNMADLDDEDEIVDSILEDLENVDNHTAEAESTEELESLADIVDIPDHSDAFLENVEIEKRPLGGGAATASSLGAAGVEKVVEFPSDDFKEEIADQEFISDKPKNNWLGGSRSGQQPQKPSKPDKLVKSSLPKPVKKSGNVALYVLLVALFVILGGLIGVIAYFSGLL